jgi:transcriptional regulator GlxA family with amidase domain
MKALPVSGNSQFNTYADVSSIPLEAIKERRLRQVVDMIDSEPACSIRDLATKVALSPTHLQRLFKRETGIHLGNLVAERRLQEAARLLTVSNLSVKEIAHSVGYRHHSSFVRAFQRRFSKAPKHYRSQDYKAAVPG